MAGAGGEFGGFAASDGHILFREIVAFDGTAVGLRHPNHTSETEVS